MRPIYTFALCASFAAYSAVRAADEVADDPKSPVDAPAALPVPGPSSGPSVWASAEYLNWWIKSGPLRTPLITVGNPADPVPGALGQPGTRIVFNDDIDFHSRHGIRLTVGGWLDADGSIGVEASGFSLANKAGSGIRASGAAAGGEGIYVPALRPDLGRPGALSISDPLAGFAGIVGVATDSQMSGVELNLLGNCFQSDCVGLDVIAGLKCVNLTERLAMAGLSSDLVLLNDFSFVDRFKTTNRFYGAQIGAQGTIGNDWVFASVRGTVAAGATEQSVNIDGSARLSGTLNGMFLGGFFSQPSNIGYRSSTDLSVIPQLSAKVGFHCFGCATLFAGYDCQYWARVVRPGNQIDARIDTPLSLGGSVQVQRSPLPLFERTDFWAQGISIGLNLAY